MHRDNPLDPDLIRQDQQLPATLDSELKQAIFELKPKFADSAAQYQPQVFVNHSILHGKHPIFRKLQLHTLKCLIDLSNFVYL